MCSFNGLFNVSPEVIVMLRETIGLSCFWKNCQNVLHKMSNTLSEKNYLDALTPHFFTRKNKKALHVIK